MKVLCYRLEDCEKLDEFMKESAQRYEAADFGVKLFINEFWQKKVCLADGKALYVAVYCATWFDLAPGFLVRYGLKKGLRKAGYAGSIERVKLKQAVKELIT